MDLSSDHLPDTCPAAVAALEMLASPALDLTFARPQRLARASAWYGHVAFAHWLIAAAEPHTLVELGTHNGVSYSAFCEAVVMAGIATRCTAVDTWEGDDHAGHYGAEVYDDLFRFHEPRYASFSSLMRCDFDTARSFFADGSIDLLHIDGLHTYEAVAHDWQVWRSALSERAVVLFHDVNERQGSFAVWRLWDELCAEFPSFTFQHAHGLGVLAVGTAVPEAVRRLCALEGAPREAARVRERFALLGERWDTHAEHNEAVDRLRAAEAGIAGLTNELAAGKRGAEQASEAWHAQFAAMQAELEAARHAAGEAREAAQRAADEAREAFDAQSSAVQAGLQGELTAVRRKMADAEMLENAADQVRAERDSAWAHQSWMEGELRQRDAQFAAAQAALAQRAEDWERVHVVLAARDRELATLRARIDAMLHSASWRLAAPFRWFGRSAPGLTRLVRRAARLTRLVVSGEIPRRRRIAWQRRADIAALRASPLFDRAFYLASNPALAAAGDDPAAHYAWVGAWQGAMPNPYFDSAWYRSRYPEVGASGRNPLLYWQEAGAAAGHDPNPFLDAAWYCGHSPAARPDPLRHFIEVGAAGNLDPNPMLDAEAYLLEHADARLSGMDALRHWWTIGAGAGLDPHPLFDAAWYRETNGLPPGADVLAHWLQTGRARNAPTSPLLARTGGERRAIVLPADPDPEATVIIPVYGHYADTFRTLYSIAAGTGERVRFAVLVADDNPACRIAPLLQRRMTGLQTRENETNLGFLRSCNEAARATTGALVFLNNDTIVHDGWLAPMLDLLDRHSDVAMVGVKLLNADGTVQEAGGGIPTNGWGAPYGAGEAATLPEFNFVREVDVVTGACFAVRREAWEAVGGFDEAYAPAFYEEFDLAFALRSRSWRVMYQPASAVSHLGSNSYGAEVRDLQSAKNHALFCRKWKVALREQPPPSAPPIRLRQRPHDMGLLLFIDDRVPEWDRHAGALTNRQYIRLWQKLGYHVVFAPFTETAALQPYTEQLQQEGVEVVHAPETLDGWLKRHGRLVDLIWTARPDVTGPLLTTLRARSAAPILYYPHDLHHLRESARWALEGDPRVLAESQRLQRLENRIFGAVDCVLCISDTEAAGVRAGVATAPIQRVPAYIYPPPPPAAAGEDFENRHEILFVGGYAHLPNVDAACFLATEIMPLVWREVPELRLVLAGSSPPQEVRSLAGARTRVPGFMPDLDPLYRQARMSVSPLRYGAGVKGKMVAALWQGLPVVCTSVAAEGLELTHGADAMLANTAEDFAAAIIALWHDPARCAALAHAGRRVIERSFTEDAAMLTIKQAVATARRRAAASGRLAAAE